MKDPQLLPRLDAALARFRELYGDGDVAVLRAPARINILGEHVDYVSYLPTASLPFGSREHAMWMLFRPADDGCVRGASMYEEGSETFDRFEFAPGDESVPDQGSEDWEAYVFSRPAPAPHWGNYVKASALFARWKFGATLDRGISFLVDSTIPPSGGASSSSALVLLAGAAIRLANQREYQPEELARESSRAEWFLGTRGGALDHTAICLAQSGKAIHLSHASGATEFVSFPGERHRWITFFSHAAAKGDEAMLEYNERAAVSRILIPAMIDDLKRHSSWFDDDWNEALSKLDRDVVVACDELESLLGELPESITLGEFAHDYPQAFRECEPAFPALLRERRDQPLKIYDRALHHLGEVGRVAAAVDLLRKPVSSRGDAAMRTIGELLDDSHESLRDLYEVCTPEVNALVDVIHRDKHVYGARLMGGGFGGNVLALTTANHAEALVNRVRKEFYAPRNREGVVMISTPGDGLSKIELL